MHKPEFRTLPLKTLAALLLGLTLTACGGGDSGSRLDNIGDDNPGGDNGGGDGPGDENEPAQLGRGSADSFVAGEIEVGLPEGNSLSPGGSTTLAVTMVNSDGELVTSSVEVSFNSDCLASGRSVLTANGEEIGTTVSTNNGRAEVTYTANGCVGADQITARATYEGLSAGSARATIDVASDTVQTVEFVGAAPEVIGLKGTGTQETSKVTFRVVGSTGSPIRDVDVDFSLTPAGTGGLSLVNTSATSNAAGEVSTTVQSGTFATSVRVTATIETEGQSISTQSSRLVVSTGIPDQNSISVAASDLHPVSWNYDGVESEITIRLADAFNNPAPDGTAVTFTSSGGAIDSSCTTEGGACTVTWRSQSPRPNPSAGFEITDDMDIVCGPTANGTCRPGRVKVLATALGNESFTDLNSNGVYDHETDIFLSDNSAGQCDPNRPAPYAEVDEDGCDDLGSAYLDKNFNEDYDSNEEIVVLSETEASDGASYANGDGIYNGVLCSDASQQAGECNRDAVTIRDDLMLVMSCHTPYTMPDGRLPGQSDVTLAPGETTTVTVLLADCNGNGMPAGTTMDLNIQGDGFEADTSLSNELVGSSEPATVTIFITADDEEPASGAILMEIIAPTPGGDIGTTPAAIGVSPSS